MRKGIYFVGIFVAGICVGYGAHDTLRAYYVSWSSPQDTLYKKEESLDARKNIPESGSQKENSTSTSTSATKNTPETTIKAPIAIPTSQLTDSQKALLSTLGVDVNSFVVTPEMVACAENALGASRVAAIVAGSKPTAVEILKVAPCI